MNLGKFTRGMAVTAFATCAFAANAQSASMYFNKFGDLATATPATIDVLAGSTVTLNFYLNTSGFTNNIAATTVFVGYDTTNTTADTAVAGGSGITVAHGGTNLTPTSIPLAWNTTNFPGGAIINRFGGGYDTTAATRPWGLWTSNLNVASDYGFSNTSARMMFSLDVTVSNTLSVGTLRPITIYKSPTNAGAWDSSVADSTFPTAVNAFPPTYVANLHVVSPVPEPASFAVLGLGLIALVRRRKK